MFEEQENKNESEVKKCLIPLGYFLYFSKLKNSFSPASEVLSFISLKPAGFIFNLSPSQKIIYKQTLDTFNVNGKSYFNVKMFEHLVAPTNLKLPKMLWYVKNVGVVKNQLYNGQVWSLRRFNVVQ